MEKEYFLGLDMGTGSVGWAVTDADYNVLRAHGKSLWGARLFESAKTAEERRGFRTSRRRLARRNWRVELLQEIFADEINRVDGGFFLRMKESRYVPEDKRNANGECPELPYALFVDPNYTDKDYHRQFPTIYHLRKWLMETDETPDIRLVYLALHHMMKHRGHFLFSGDIETIRNFGETFAQFIEAIKGEELDFNLSITAEDSVFIEETLKNRDLTRSTKKTRLIKGLGANTACEKAILTLISGGTAQLKDIFSDEELKECEQSKICFADNNYDEYQPSVEDTLGERYFIIEWAKAVYDWSVLADILGEHKSLSEAKIEVYEKHRHDLAYLKKLVRENLGKEAYYDIFISTDDKMSNYSAYIGMAKKNGKKQALVGKSCTREEFYKFLKKNVVDKIADEGKISYLTEELDKETFLPKQTTKDNGVLPHQIHLYELNRILENLKDRVPLLKENEDKIRQIFTFRIPYYVGPLNGIRKGDDRTNWAVRKAEGKIYPWNFEDMIDTQQSAEKFIRRMTNKCTYLPHEDVLPKNSLLYAKFTVLNELNNLRINGEEISVELKQRIYENVFCKTRKVTQKKLRNYLITEESLDRSIDITGIDGDFKGTLTAYHDFKEKLTGCPLNESEKEEIVLNITLFGEDKSLLRKRLQARFPQLTDKQLKSLCALRYQGWGRLSKEFLCEITAPAPETGEVWNIITALWETNDNLMQLLGEKYKFVDAMNDWNASDGPRELSYNVVDDMAVSPAVKRQIWQALLIVKEICKVMGNPPKRVFVEMAREKREGKRTESRKSRLMELYKKCKNEERDWMAELGETEEQRFRGDKLFLYYTQMGRCAYSGEAIPLEDLWDNQKYDIDHIYPQSKVMDDSLDNRVLVRKDYNAHKSDSYPIEDGIRKKMQPYWNMLLNGGFISNEKYKRLTRATDFEPDELAGFIARQLVETRQGTKAVASILKQALPETEIVYAKASVTSKFRQDFDFIKVRDMNDLHHAKDAYLNIVVGNTYFVKFTKNASWYIKNYPGRSYNLQKLFISQNVERNGEIAWKAGDNGTICTVKRIMDKNNILVTRQAFEATGGLFKQQILKKGHGQVPIKGCDERLQQIDKYGGYDKATGAYFMLVESEDKKGDKIRTLEFVPLYLKNQLDTEEKAECYFSKNLKNPRIILPMIKINTLFKVEGFYMWLSSRTDNRLLFKGGVQLLLPQKETATLKKVLKFVQRRIGNKNLELNDMDGLDAESLIALYDAFLLKLENSIYKMRRNSQRQTLIDGRELFVKLENEEKCLVLSEILHLFQCQGDTADLRLIGGSKNSGTLKIIKDITSCKQISIINQSPTGIFENEIDLLKI